MKQTKIYAEHLEQTALDQFNSAMEQDFAVKGALMPDAHTGYTLPIGAVVATDGVIVPSWAGYDIGCGMCAMQTTFDMIEVAVASQAIFDEIYRRVPVGFHVNDDQHIGATFLNSYDLAPLGREAFNGRKRYHSLGTLGGGNHFIEIGCDKANAIWVIIHSGSRGVGHGIATEYMKLASGGPKPMEGHFGLRVDSDDGQACINDMNWALQFALDNRIEMMKRVIAAMNCHTPRTGSGIEGTLINRNHNHAEERDGLWIHRKGATHAEAGMMGVIPGNMRDGTFIVRGKGNPDALWSSSHGAGRVMGRKQAKRELDTDDFKVAMRGVTAKVGDSTLDESPMAYKNIFEVMALQADLVDVVAYIKPIINVKG
jgi:tRNA-splicing ligase RtcB